MLVTVADLAATQRPHTYVGCNAPSIPFALSALYSDPQVSQSGNLTKFLNLIREVSEGLRETEETFLVLSTQVF